MYLYCITNFIMSQQLRKRKKPNSSSSGIHLSVQELVQKRTAQSRLLFSPSIRPHVARRPGAVALDIKERWATLGFSTYQKDVVNRMMNATTTKIQREGTLKPTLQHTCICPNEYCKLEQKETVHYNWSNPYKHLVSIY